jgi:SAM-dependent methyltransferase
MADLSVHRSDLSAKRLAEYQFWHDLAASHGEYYYAYRVAEYYEKTRYFPSWLAQEGSGLDVGCGCISVFEGSSKYVRALDVLAFQYHALLRSDLHIPMLPMQEDLVPGKYTDFAWAACLNMIDHTPNPLELLKSIHRALVPGATLYFEVNLEAGLATPHYEVWTEATVKNKLVDSGLFREKFRFIQDVPEHNQRRYWAEFERI